MSAISIVHAVLTHWGVVLEETNFARTICSVHDSAITISPSFEEFSFLNSLDLTKRLLALSTIEGVIGEVNDPNETSQTLLNLFQVNCLIYRLGLDALPN